MTQMVSGAPALTDSVFALRSGASPTNLIFAIRDIFNLYSTGTHSKDIYGNMTVYGVLNVTGDVFTRNNTHLGNSITDTTYVIGAARVSGDVYVSGHGVFTGDLNASGNTSLGRNSSSTTRVSGTLTVNGSGDFHNTLNLRKGAVNSLGYTGLGNHVFGTDSSNSQTLKGTVGVTNSINVGGDLAVFGNKTTAGNERITGTLGVGGNVFLSGNLEAGSYASNHTALINSTTTVRKATFLESTLGVSSHATFSGNLNVSGTVNLGDSATDVVNIAGIANCKSLFVGANMSVAGGEIVAGSSTIMGTGLFVGGAFTNGLRVSGTTNLGSSSSSRTHVIGSLHVAQNTTLSGNLNLASSSIITTPYLSVTKGECLITFDPSVRISLSPVTYNSTYGTVEVKLSAGDVAYYENGDFVYITGMNAVTTVPVSYCGLKRISYVTATGIGLNNLDYTDMTNAGNGAGLALLLAKVDYAYIERMVNVANLVVDNAAAARFGTDRVNWPRYNIYPTNTPNYIPAAISLSCEYSKAVTSLIRRPYVLHVSGLNSSDYGPGVGIGYSYLPIIFSASDGSDTNLTLTTSAANLNKTPGDIHVYFRT